MQIVHMPGLDPEKYSYLTLLTNHLTMDLWNVASKRFDFLDKEADEDNYNKAMNIVRVVLMKNPGFFKEEELIKMANNSSFIQDLVDTELRKRFGEREDEIRKRDEESQRVAEELRKRDEESRKRDEESRKRDEESRERDDKIRKRDEESQRVAEELRKRDEESRKLQNVLLEQQKTLFQMMMNFMQGENGSQQKQVQL